MNVRRIIVNAAIILVLAGIAYFCYDHGKAYDFIVDNTAYKAEGQELGALEAVQLRVDKGEGKIFYADDRDQTVAIGSGKHTARIDMLDLDDKPIEGQSKVYTFTIKSPGEVPILNLPFAYKNGAPVK